uniref:LRRK2 beta-propeller domain-containing protein n=1 Tax=Amphimedon queenslandica TaxID=400682 RepID=A0A1X7V3V1_AMPQE
MTLTLEHSRKRNKKMDAFVGHLALSSQEKNDIAWSAHLGGTTLSAWDTQNEEHLYDIDVREVLMKQIGIGDESAYDAIMTCMTPALDVVWVGMATGHILLFHEQELIMHFHPYTQHLRFLITVPCEGPCQKEKCMVVSGAKGFQSPLEGYPLDDFPQTEEDKSQSLDNSGVMILWEAYSGATLRQMKVIEEESPGYLDNHKTVARMIKKLQFKDDTHIVKDLTTTTTDESESSPSVPIDDTCETLKPFETSYTPNDHSPDPRSSMMSYAGSESGKDVPLDKSSSRSSPEPIENPNTSKTHTEGLPFSYKVDAKQMQGGDEPTIVHHSRAGSYALTNETFDIDIQGRCQGQLLRISCPKPVSLQTLLSKVKMEGNFENIEDFNMAYRQGDSGEVVCISSQDKFDQYMEIKKRPNLLLYVSASTATDGE